MSNIAELYDVLGVEMPTEETSEQTQEVADPAEEASEQNQEVAEPDADVDTDALEEPEEEIEPEEPKREPMSKEERAANAKRRRQQEIDEAVNKAREEERTAMNGRISRFLKQAQIKNVYKDGKPIETLEDGEAWAEANRLAQVEKDLSKGKLTPEALQTVVEQSPVVQKLQEQLTATTRAAEAAEKQQFDKSVEVELAEIQKLDPTIQNLTDILDKPEGKTWAGYVQRNNMNYLDAYKLAFHDQIVARAQTAAQMGAAMKDRGKSHLKATGARGQGAVEVPARVKDYYRQFQPNMTDAEIAEDYNKRMQE